MAGKGRGHWIWPRFMLVFQEMMYAGQWCVCVCVCVVRERVNEGGREERMREEGRERGEGR